MFKKIPNKNKNRVNFEEFTPTIFMVSTSNMK